MDDLGRTSTVLVPVERVVSLVPSTSEMVCLLDCERLVGGTRYDRFPAELVQRVKAGKIAVVGGGFDPNIEKVVQLKPDVVFADGPSQERAVHPIRELGLPVVSFNPKTLEEIERNFLLLGKLLGQEAKAQSLVQEMRASLKKLRARAGAEQKKRVFVQSWPEPILTPGRGSLTSELLEPVGGENIFDDLPFSSGQVSLEAIIQRDPEVVIFLDGLEGFAQQALRRREWKGIQAIQQGHICFLDGAFLRPTIRYLDGMRKLYDCLHDFANFDGEL